MPPKRKTAASKTAAEAEAPDAVETPETVGADAVAVEEPAPAETGTGSTAAAEAEPAPAIVVAGSPTEMYAQLQVVVAQSPSRINDHVGPLLELMHTAEDPASPLLLRVRFLEFIGKTVAHLRDNAALKKIVTSLVKIIGAEDNTPQLLVAALQCFPGLGPVSMLDKGWEYLSREGADILMQVILDKEVFSETVRQAARKSLDALTDSAFRSVATKLIHWLSDDREDDEPEQIRRERQLAVSTLYRMAMAHSMKAHWTEETQTYVLSLVYRVLGIVDSREFGQLARIAAHLPQVSEKHGLPMLEAYVAENALNTERNIEAVSILGRFIHTSPKKGDAAAAPAEFDLVTPMEKAGLLNTDRVDPVSREGMIVARVALTAARLAPADVAEKLLQFIVNAVLSLVGNDGSSLPENLSTLEAMLFAAVAISTKKSAEMLQTLNEEGFNGAMTAVTATAAALEPELTFAIKKKMRDNTATAADAEALACVHNIRVITGAFAAKHVPQSELKESWVGKAKLPAVKRGRDRAANVLPPQPGTAAAHDRTRFGGDSGNGDRKRGHSESGRPHKMQRTGGSSNNRNNNSSRGGNEPRHRRR